jgi:hypothetical protein
LKKEITDFEKEKNRELSRIQEYKNEEMKKLKLVVSITTTTDPEQSSIFYQHLPKHP